MRKIISILVFSSLLFSSIVGGAFLGYFSCGGYAWHEDAIHIVILGAVVLGLAFPIEALRKFWLRPAYPFIGIGFFVFFQGLTSAFYPRVPESFEEFWKLFLIGLQYGPC